MLSVKINIHFNPALSASSSPKLGGGSATGLSCSTTAITEIEKLPQYQETMEKLEAVKHQTAGGKDYWRAREINLILGYPQWREFEEVIDRAKSACAGAKIPIDNHFGPTHKMVEVGSGAKRQVDDYFLSRAACYFVAMNGDPSKPEIAAAQAYFAISRDYAERGRYAA
jgi:DNA-damage-inducible protein D